MKKIYKSPAIEAVEIETVGMISTSPGGNRGVGSEEGAGIGAGGAQSGRFEAGRNRGFGNLWGDN